ncbi:ABC transporter ATP-binding protein [Methylobacterium sp. UNC300MFChir4.1]|uniref:ABC transporter ATP-binding protein n=1 Tax=Methylobacterium sp. UNC300MFChir4.1 TaxID=1502747 RepID=UPI000C20FDE8|nr:ABC transporter ATP-binding protein [Methylobacterium sp. UNC300MFChir4.1]
MSRLVAESVTVSERGLRLLDAVSLTLEPGHLVGLIGPNGAGKSTLLRSLAGLRDVSSGRIALDGHAVSGMGAAERGRRIGYLPQSFQPAWDYTVREVVELGASRRPGAGAGLPASLAEHELTALADRPWSRLSGGERARTLLAAILIAQPDVVLADEPGAALDIRHSIDLMRRLSAYARDHTVVVILHDLDRAARDCGRLVLMERGRIVLDGPAEDVAGSPVLDQVFGVRFARRTPEPGADAVLWVGPGQ